MAYIHKLSLTRSLEKKCVDGSGDYAFWRENNKNLQYPKNKHTPTVPAALQYNVIPALAQQVSVNLFKLQQQPLRRYIFKGQTKPARECGQHWCSRTESAGDSRGSRPQSHGWPLHHVTLSYTPQQEPFISLAFSTRWCPQMWRCEHGLMRQDVVKCCGWVGCEATGADGRRKPLNMGDVSR